METEFQRGRSQTEFGNEINEIKIHTNIAALGGRPGNAAAQASIAFLASGR